MEVNYHRACWLSCQCLLILLKFFALSLLIACVWSWESATADSVGRRELKRRQQKQGWARVDPTCVSSRKSSPHLWVPDCPPLLFLEKSWDDRHDKWGNGLACGPCGPIWTVQITHPSSWEGHLPISPCFTVKWDIATRQTAKTAKDQVRSCMPTAQKSKVKTHL